MKSKNKDAPLLDVETLKHINRPQLKARRKELKAAREQNLSIRFEPGEETIMETKSFV